MHNNAQFTLALAVANGNFHGWGAYKGIISAVKKFGISFSFL